MKERSQRFCDMFWVSAEAVEPKAEERAHMSTTPDCRIQVNAPAGRDLARTDSAASSRNTAKTRP